MRKISLVTLGFFAKILTIFGQSTDDTLAYKSKKLSIDEINIVSSYYHQEGINSAVTGGIGTEKLSDYANSIDIRMYRYKNNYRKNTLTLDIGVDHFTSASSDNVSPNTGTNASSSSIDAKDTRVYPSVIWESHNENKKSMGGFGLSLSHEFDYLSFGGNIIFSKSFRQDNSEISGKFNAYFDQLKLVYPSELIPATTDDDDDDDDDDHRPDTGSSASSSGDDDKTKYPKDYRQTLSASLTYAHIVNKSIQVALITDFVYQHGYLGLPFHRVYFSDNTEAVEKLPTQRIKVPIGMRANFFLGDKFIVRTYYRWYYDTWNLKSNTVSVELPIKITPFISLSPFYRFYQQSQIKYFAPYKENIADSDYYTSNYDLSTFMSHFMGLGIRMAPPNGILGMKHINMLEIRYGYYTKNINFNANVVTLNLKFK